MENKSGSIDVVNSSSWFWDEKTFESKQTVRLEGEKNAIGLVAVSATKGL